MTILLLGKDGQLGWELQRALAPLGDLVSLARQDVDFENIDQLQKIIIQYKPSVIVNAVAYTAVDKAESEPEKAFLINAKAVEVIAQEAKKNNALFVHYSTDYVFDGEKEGAYNEQDATDPLSVYGKSKAAGEIVIQNSGCNYLIFRTSWIYAARGKNFAKTILKLAQDRDVLNIISDQYGAPTSAELIADVTALALFKIMNDKGDYNGIYHLTASGRVTWYEYACYIIDLAKKKGIEFKAQRDNIKAISTDEYPVAAVRPKNSCLNTDKIKSTFGITLPDWKHHMQRFIEEVVL